jgi:hypothetical protein
METGERSKDIEQLIVGFLQSLLAEQKYALQISQGSPSSALSLEQIPANAAVAGTVESAFSSPSSAKEAR